jgi:hypothetical protein
MPRTPGIVLHLEPLEDRCVPSTATVVTQLYVNLLGRVPGPGEAVGWIQQLNSGVSPSQVALGFTHSLEFRVHLIRLETQAFDGRVATAAELNAATTQLLTGVSDQALEAQILASQEFLILNDNTPLTWLTSVFQEVLGRPPDSLGLNHFLGLLGSGTSFETVSQAIVNSAEAHARQVTSMFVQTLNRTPDLAGLNFWVNRLNLGLSPGDVAALIAASPEFLARAGGLDVTTVVAPSTPALTQVSTLTTVTQTSLIMSGVSTTLIPPQGGGFTFPAQGGGFGFPGLGLTGMSFGF